MKLTTPIRKRKIRWALVRGFPDYEISDDGQLRRITVSRSGYDRRGLIKGIPDKRGYHKYNLTDRLGVCFTRHAHRLIGIAFIPNPENHPFVLHWDDDKTHNDYLNLYWGTSRSNWDDAVRNGGAAIGDRHPSHTQPWIRQRGSAHVSAKLTEAQVRCILKTPGKQRAIARLYGVDQALIQRIRAGKVWRHISDKTYADRLERRQK